MSITPSVSSARALLSPNGYISNEQGQRTPGTSPSIYTFSKSLPSAKLPNDGLNLNPDELFTKYAVSEVRVVQHRLRADADAKQEELRLMVGERYRDLLQASSSIISIAKSSRHVCEALEECRDVIISQNDLPLPPVTATASSVSDRHLYTLQVLSAHMRILLDAPEHLWRLIERKKYLPAAWLFLLARVVYQALVRNDDADEQSWISEGIDVSAEFPLVQRQWEMVSQFRSQIIHKSTLSLREASISTEDTCAILVTLHLLDSRPLNETLAALLLQRSKTLQSILTWNSDGGIPNLSHNSNGNATERKSQDVVTSVPVREMTQIVKKALNIISQSVCTARSIFQHEASELSLIGRVLESIHADSSKLDGSSQRLPDELYLSTESLLASLTSSANFQLLPSTIRSYKPYVDLNSSSTFLAQPQFSQKVQAWFQQSTNLWQTCAGGWLTGLQTVKEVWTLRSSIRRWIMASGLKEEEKVDLSSTTDSLCHERIVRIWTQTLTGAEALFKSRLNSYVSEPQPDISPLDFLFQSTPVPILSQTLKSFVDTSFQKYQLALKRQLLGRSAQLDHVLSALEQCARTIQHDFSIVKAGTGGDEKTKPFVNQLTEAYQPAANILSINVISIIDKMVLDATDNATGSTANGLVFLSRVTEDLASASLFVENIACSHYAGQEFKSKLALSNTKIIQKWRETIVTQIIRDSHFLRGKHPSESATPDGPSPQLVQSLLSVSDSTRRLGIACHPARQKVVVQDTLRLLITSWINEGWENYGNQALHDLAFLRKIADAYGSEWEDISALLAGKLKANASDSTDHENIESCASEYLARTQTLFSGLLPSLSETAPESQLLQFGVPSTRQNYHSVLDLAKPSPRFGMLLVGNTDR
ncbi:hypothetical protein BYT27DRAFT_7189922 [Phlegmacium glaucopus]|nr:hypothetical protein BYT27DRAFT_7189922 [Phlegmacium glaucopus]